MPTPLDSPAPELLGYKGPRSLTGVLSCTSRRVVRGEHMHIAIATVGTRGDAQPYVALGAELMRRGHRVTLVTHEDHRALAVSNGLGFRAVCGSFRDTLRSPEGVAWLESADKPLQYLEAFRALVEPTAASFLQDFDQALDDCDAVLVHSFAMAAAICATRRGLPMVVLSPFLAVPTSQVSMMGLLGVPLIGGWLEKAAFSFFLDRAWSAGAAATAAYLASHGQPAPSAPPWRTLLQRGVAHLHLVSPTLVARPSDWPACAEVTGHCFLDALPDWQPPAALEAFLAAGEAPVYVGFGSMTGMDPATLAALAHEALRRSKRRAVVSMGWGGMKDFADSSEVLIIDDVPHDWLFPRVAAVVHHAGAGTVGAALRAGKPSVTVPFFADQPAWARLLSTHGVGTTPLPKQKLTAERLARAIVEATTNERLRTRAEAMGASLRAESGVQVTADRVLHHLPA